jgi:hypothetical protein
MRSEGKKRRKMEKKTRIEELVIGIFAVLVSTSGGRMRNETKNKELDHRIDDQEGFSQINGEAERMKREMR